MSLPAHCSSSRFDYFGDGASSSTSFAAHLTEERRIFSIACTTIPGTRSSGELCFQKKGDGHGDTLFAAPACDVGVMVLDARWRGRGGQTDCRLWRPRGIPERGVGGEG